MTVLRVPYPLDSGQYKTKRERVLYGQPTGPILLNGRDDFSGPALRLGCLNYVFQVAVHLSSSVKNEGTHGTQPEAS